MQCTDYVTLGWGNIVRRFDSTEPCMFLLDHSFLCDASVLNWTLAKIKPVRFRTRVSSLCPKAKPDRFTRETQKFARVQNIIIVRERLTPFVLDQSHPLLVTIQAPSFQEEATFEFSLVWGAW